MALGFMRRHRRWLYYFLWLVILGFIVFYIPAFRAADQGGRSEVLGRVGNLPVTVGEFQRAYFERRRQFEQIYQGRLDAAGLKKLGLEEQVFDDLVAQRLVSLEAQRLGLTVDDETLARSLVTAPDLQRDGRFVGAAELRRLLELRGRTIEEFEEERRAQLLAERLQNLVTDGVTVTAEEAERELRKRTEQIRAEYVLVDAERFKKEVVITGDEVKARFEARREAYRVPEKRVVSYLLLEPGVLRARIVVADREIEAYYQEHKDELKEPEQVCANHILVKVKASAAATEGHGEAEARKIAHGLLDRLKAGADFAGLAKESSEDKGSAERGGDLRCFPRGAMVPEFEQAAFALEAGQTSGLVKSALGFHVIRVTSRKEETIPAISQVRERIRTTLLDERVQALAEEKIRAIIASLGRGRSLEETARESGLQVQKSPPLARGESTPPIDSPALVSRAFELKVGEVDRNGFALPRGYAFIALFEVRPPHLPELKEVDEKIRADLVEEKTLERARALAGDVRARANDLGLEKAAAAVGLVRKETPGLVGRGTALGDLASSFALDEAAFGLPEKKTVSAPIQVPSGFVVLRVLEKKLFDPAASEKERARILTSLREEKRNRMFQAYMLQARRRYAVERHPEVLRRVVG